MMNGKRTVFIDQHGNVFFARNRAALRRQFGNGWSRIRKLYIYHVNRTYHAGYIIAGHRLRAYQPIEIEVKHHI